MFAGMKGAGCFTSSIGLASGLTQLQIAEEDTRETAFRERTARFETLTGVHHV